MAQDRGGNLIIYVCPGGGALHAATEEDREMIEALVYGGVYKAEIKKIRNPRFHRKFFSLIDMVYKNQDKYRNKQEMLLELKYRTGHFDTYKINDIEFVVTKSISFDKMDDTEFSLFYKRSIDALLEMLPQFGIEDIDQMAREIIGYS